MWSKKLKELNREMNNSATVGDFNIPFSEMELTIRQNINKKYKIWTYI